MRILLHTPLKAPGHRTPSGDRAMARALRDVLRSAGHQVKTLDRGRSGKGLDTPEQQKAERDAAKRRFADALNAKQQKSKTSRIDLWLTYHCYYKKPDWIGAALAKQAGIPYVLAEVSYAPKRADGPWDLGHRQVAVSIRAADLILNFNPIDANCVRPVMNKGAVLLDVPPFIDTKPFAAAAQLRGKHRAALKRKYKLDDTMPWLLSVAMMRPGDKLASYRVLGQALSGLQQHPWRLLVVGDGQARPEVEAALKPLGDRVVYLGEQAPDKLPALYAAADLYLWPAINEAWGMTLLEAQATGLPVIAGRTGGVPNVMRENDTGLLTPIGDAAQFAAAVERLLGDPARRREMGELARAYAAQRHDRRVAANLIDQALRDAVERRR
ncbi:MAG: glycosyltransferase family 4 protein [Rhodospirillales bacterium]